jgi:hypothetical protein
MESFPARADAASLSFIFYFAPIVPTTFSE